MRGKRLIDQIKFLLINNPYKRADFLKSRKIFFHIGDDVSFQPRKIPLYGQLIDIGNNVVIGSNVSFLTHDGYHAVCNRAYPDEHIEEKAGCIKIGNDCFVGANSSIMYDVQIGNDVVVAAGAVVTKDIPSGEVWGGVPAKCIGKTEDLRKRYKCNPSINIQRESIEEKSVEQMWKLFYRKRSI